MKKLDFSQTIGILANLCVVVGIAFVVVEVSQNNQSLLADAQTLRTEELARLDQLERDRALTVLESREFRALYVKSLVSPSDLSAEDVWGMTAYLYGRLAIVERAYIGFQDQVITEADWRRRLSEVPYFLGTRFGKFYWQFGRDDFLNTDGFVEAVDEELKSYSGLPDDDWLLDFMNSLEGSPL